MRTILKWTAALGLAACLGTTANAQGQGRGMGMMGMGGGLNLLSNKSVQKELKLTDEQVTKATAASTEQMEKNREKFAELRDLDPSERQEKMQSMMKEITSESKKVTDEILKPEQAKRFAQIELQAQGFQAYMSPEVQSKLKMTDDQKDKIKDMQEESMQKMADIRDEFQDDRAGMMKKMTEMRDGMAKKATELLTDEQKATWKDMTGAPFTLVREPMGRRPGGAL